LNTTAEIASRLDAVRRTIPQGVEMVAVSKFHAIDRLRAAYDAGQRLFGESRVQELLEKIPQMPADTRWHFIGHLQTNKVRQLVGHTSMIESVDSERLLELIDRESERAGVISRVLMQVHVAKEETKFGFKPDELVGYFQRRGFENLRATHICGIMGMASNTDDTDRVRSDFAEIARTYRRILAVAPDLRGFDQISMGMSGDYPTAIEEGATLVRIGTAIFGNREY